MSQEIKYLGILILSFSFRYGIHQSYSCISPIMHDLICTINGIEGKSFYIVLLLIILTLDNLQHRVSWMQIP